MVPLYYLYLGFSKENLCALGDDYGECIVQEIALKKSILWENGPLQCFRLLLVLDWKDSNHFFKQLFLCHYYN